MSSFPPPPLAPGARAKPKRVFLRADRFDDWLIRRNTTSREFARVAGLGRSTIDHMRGKSRGVSPQVRAIVQEATGMEWDELFRIEGEE